MHETMYSQFNKVSHKSHCVSMIMKMKGVLKDGCTVNYTFNTTCTGILFKSLNAWGVSPQCLLFFILRRGTYPLLLIWGNESTTPRPARLMEKHVNEGHFSYFAPRSKGLIQEGASLRLNSSKHEHQRGTTLPQGMGRGTSSESHD